MIKFITSCANKSQYEKFELPQIVLTGRSNAGKSSFINSYFNNKVAKTGKTPGKTQLLNFFDVDGKYLVVDVPGYGFADLSEKQILDFGDMMEDYFYDNKYLTMMIMIVDARHKPTEDDVDMINVAKFYELNTIVIANKIDKVSNSELKKNIEVIADTLDIDEEFIIPYTCEKQCDKSKIDEFIKMVLNEK